MQTWLVRWWRLSSTPRIYAREVLLARKGLWLSAFCTIVGLLTLPIQGLWPLLVSLGLIVLGVVQLAWELLALRRAQEDHLLRPRALDHLLHDGLTPALAGRGYVLEREGRHSMVRSPHVDAALFEGAQVALVRDAALWAAPDSDAAGDLRLMVLAEKLRGRQVVFDGLKVRLANDLVLGSDRSIADAQLQPTRYTSTLWTNDLASSVLLREGAVVFDGLDTFTQDGRICSLESSSCADAIGVSTVAFDPLGAVYFVQQGRRNVQGPGLLSPSGSGSADWSDLRPEDDLGSFVRRVAEREMREELGLGPEVRARTKVMGFGRWVARGAKPEFFCLTKLDRPVPRGRLTPEERLFTHRGGTEVLPLPLRPDDAAGALAAVLADRKETLSVPLFWCLALMRDRLLDETQDDLVSKVFTYDTSNGG